MWQILSNLESPLLLKATSIRRVVKVFYSLLMLVALIVVNHYNIGYSRGHS
jgi:hypothetical protein